MDPFLMVMLGLIVLLMFFMFRNGKKRQQAIQEMHSNMNPGTEVMLQSGIFGTIEEIDEEDNRVTVRSGTSSLVVHRNAIAQIVTPSELHAASDSIAPDDDPDFSDRFDLAPDDDPEFGNHIADAGNDEHSSGSENDGKPKA